MLRFDLAAFRAKTSDYFSAWDAAEVRVDVAGANAARHELLVFLQDSMSFNTWLCPGSYEFKAGSEVPIRSRACNSIGNALMHRFRDDNALDGKLDGKPDAEDIIRRRLALVANPRLLERYVQDHLRHLAIFSKTEVISGLPL